MASFISDFSKYIINTNTSFKDICIVVPNHRARLFIKKELSEIIKKPTIAPEITTIKDIFIDNSKIVECDDIYLLYKLFNIYKRNTGTSDDFDEFYFWGEIILRDFDNIDKYLIDPEQLFSNIIDIKQIDSTFSTYDESELEIIKKFWQHIDQAKLSEHKKSFLNLWEKMFKIYSDFNKELKAEGIGYEGLIYKTVVNNISEFNFTKSKYFFLGFNALNRCEFKLFKHIKANKDSLFFWDADKYYINDKTQEAGLFIRDNIRHFPNAQGFDFSDSILSKNTNIEVLLAPSEIAQVKLVPDILEQWSKENDFDIEKTAIILGDENLLIPLIYSIPEKFQNFNVSMGYPIKSSSAFSFINHLCSLQKTSIYKNETELFYFKSVINFIKHPYISSIFEKDCRNLEKNIVNNKQIYIDNNTLNVNELFKLIFSNKKDKNNINQLADYFNLIIDKTLLLLSEHEKFKFEVEFLRRSGLRLKVLSDTISKHKIEFTNHDIFFRLVINSLKNLSVPFEGEPLSGMQVMGFLETRLLDFDRIILLSINEGYFPKKNMPQSIIPYNLKRFYGLPSLEYHDSIYAYYFYRLLHKSKDIKIIYSAQAQDGPGEASRFISQLDYELNNLKIKKTAYKIKTVPSKDIIVDKTPIIMEKIFGLLSHRISPSKINTLLNCPLMFYFQNIEKIKEPEKLEEKDDAAYFGSVFHESVKILYDNLPKSKVLQANDLNELKNTEKIENAIKKGIAKTQNISEEKLDSSVTKSLLSEVIKKYIHLLIDHDIKSLPLSIVDLETEKSFGLKIISDNREVACNIAGIIDRVDLKDGNIRVLDYKTGKVKRKTKSVDDLFNNDRETDLNGITQTMIYALMFSNEENKYPILPGLININELNTNSNHDLYFDKQVISMEDKDLFDRLIILLKEKLAELVNKNISFTQTSNEKTCEYCDYKTICMR